MNSRDLITAAQAAHADYRNDLAIEEANAAAQQDEAQADFLRQVAAHAVGILGEAATGLPWTSVSDGDQRPYAATTALPPGHTHDRHLNARYNRHQSVFSLALVRTCRSCSDQLTDQVGSLEDLGGLLDEGQPDDAGTDDQEPGPLAAVDAAEQRAASVAALARRILAQHPDTGLTVESAVIFGHEDGDSSANLRIKANGMDALRSVAAAMGRDVVTRTSGTHPDMVFEHGSVKYTVDSIEVELLAYTRLTDDEAAARLAQQDQPAAEASDGGDI